MNNELMAWLKFYDENFPQATANYDGGMGMTQRAVSDRASMLGRNNAMRRMFFATERARDPSEGLHPNFFQDRPMEALKYTPPESGVGRLAGGEAPATPSGPASSYAAQFRNHLYELMGMGGRRG